MNIQNSRETVGKMAIDAQQKALETTDVREQGSAMLAPYLHELFKTVESGKNKNSGNFFVVVITKREKLLKNVIRNYFFYRTTCPTPDYDQAVYYYTKHNEELNLLWVIPTRDICFYIKDNVLTLDDEYRELMKYVLDYEDGTLYSQCQKLNNEDKLESRVVLKEIHEQRDRVERRE